MEGLVGFAVVNILTELHFVAGSWRLRPHGDLGLEVLRREAVTQVMDDVLGLIRLIDIPPDRQITLRVLGVAVVEVDQQLLEK